MLIRQTLLYLPAQVLAPAVQFASILVWAYLLSPHDLGVVTLLIATQEISYAAFFGWWGFYTLRFISSHEEGESRIGFLKAETIAIGCSALIQSLVALPILHLVFGAALDGTTTGLALAFMLTRSLNNYNADRARAETRITLYSLVQVVGPVIGFLFGLLCIWRFGPSPAAVIAGFIVAQLIGVGLAVGMSDFLHRAGRSSWSVFKTALGFGGTQTMSQLLTHLALNAPRFIVSHQLGLAAVGIFSVGYSLGMRASSFAVTLVTAGAYPMVVRKMRVEGREAAFAQLRQNMVMVAMVVTPVAFGLLGANRSIVEILIAAPYREMTTWVLPLAALGGLFRFLRAHTSDQVFLLNLRPGFGTMIALCDFIVGVAAAFAGIAMFGLIGAAMGPMLSGSISFTLSFILSRYRFGFRAPLAAFAGIALASVIMAGAVALFPAAGSMPMLALQVGTGALVYLAAIAVVMRRDARAAVQMLKARRRGGAKADANGGAG